MNVNQITTTMRTLSIALSILLLGAMPSCSAQVKNARTLNVKVDGDCGMCEKTIERVGSIKGESEVDWDVDSHMASVTYDSVGYFGQDAAKMWDLVDPAAWVPVN